VLLMGLDLVSELPAELKVWEDVASLLLLLLLLLLQLGINVYEVALMG